MELDMNKSLKGTTTIGIVCKDGIVLAADKRSSAGYRIADKFDLKIHKITDNMAVCMAGLVSDAQLIIKRARSELMLKKISPAIQTAMLSAILCIFKADL